MVQFYSIDSEDEETNQQHADHPDGMALVVDRETPQYRNSHDPKGTTNIRWTIQLVWIWKTLSMIGWE